MNSKIKKMLAGVMCFCTMCTITVNIAVAEDNIAKEVEGVASDAVKDNEDGQLIENDVNPFLISVTPLNEKNEFTINIKVSKECVVEAFKVNVDYDKEYVEIADTLNEYGNYDTFLDKYNSNKKGICLNNHIGNENRIVFTGAQPQKEAATLVTGDSIGFVNFKVINNSDIVTDVATEVATDTATEVVTDASTEVVTDASTEVVTDASTEVVMDVLKHITVTVENYSDGEQDYAKLYPQKFKQLEIIVDKDDLRGETAIMGDINLSGKVDLSDASMALRAALGIIKLEDKNIRYGDMDNDKKISLSDTVTILRKALGIE